MNTANRYASAVTALAVALVSAALLWGCETKPEPAAKDARPVVGVLVYKQDDTYVSLVTTAIQLALADRAGVEVFDAGGDQMLQNEQIDTGIRKKFSALALNIVDPLAAGRVVDMVKKAGIPVVFFNREPDLGSIKGYSKASFVGTNPFDAGIMQGDIIKELWEKHPEYDRNRDGKCQYLMIQANLDNPEAVARTEYSVKRARELGVDMRQGGETLLCNWDENLAYEAASLVLPLHKDTIELIIANNDMMALGAIKALNEAGYNLEGGDPARFIPVVGVDAVPQAVAAIRQGIMSATVVQDGEVMGKTIAAMLMNAVDGKDFLDGVPFPWDESGIAVRIPHAHFSNEN